jgi:hypothetical protein
MDGFASSPIRGWRRLVVRMAAPVLFRLPLSRFALRMSLLGFDCDPALVDEVKEAICTVHPAVFISRLREVLSCDATTDLANIQIPVFYL